MQEPAAQAAEQPPLDTLSAFVEGALFAGAQERAELMSELLLPPTISAIADTLDRACGSDD